MCPLKTDVPGQNVQMESKGAVSRAYTSAWVVTALLRSFDKVISSCFLPTEAILGLVVTLTISVFVLTPNLIFVLFGSRSSDFKSSFKLRKGHLKKKKKKLPSHWNGQSRSKAARLWNFRTNWKVIWTSSLAVVHHHTPENAVPKNVDCSCTYKVWKRRGQYEGAWVPITKSQHNKNNQ